MSQGTDEPWNDVGRLLAGRYRLLGPIGRGGMGTVWHAVDEFLGRDVAVKQVLIPAGIPADERVEIYARSLREARIAARLRHPAVVTIYDVLTEDGRPQIVMELMTSPSLQDLITEEGPLRPDRVTEIGLAVAGALRAAHAADVLHRDVKPSNVLVGADGRVVLTDFGIARREGDPRITATGRVIGSPGYIAPELAQGTSRASPAADLWSLGATLYTAVEGRPPYQEDSILALLAAAQTKDPAPMRNAGPLTSVIHGLMARDPAERLSAEQAEKLLREVRYELASQDQRGSPTMPTRRPTRSQHPQHTEDPSTTVPIEPDPVAPPRGGRGARLLRVLAAVMVAVAVAAGGFALASLWLGKRPPASPTFTYHDTVHGFSIAVPVGWQQVPIPQVRRNCPAAAAEFTMPGVGLRPDLRIDWCSAPEATPITELGNTDEDFQRDSKGRPGYQRVRLERLAVQGQDAAELEYTYLRPEAGDTWRVLVRQLAAPNGRFIIRWRTPQDQWVEFQQLRRAVLTSFRPVSRPTQARQS
jgi:eukaryotic-like serine/threonine-protein kinase